MAKILSAENLTFSYNQLEILKNVNFEISEGETFSIVGPSGSGKSTLLMILNGLLKPSTGNVFWKDTQINLLSPDEIRFRRTQYLSMVFQNFYLIPHLSALENLLVLNDLQPHKPKITKSEAEYWLKRVGLEHRIKHRPSTLSGGEKQRLAIARSLCEKPKLLLADEPTGNLDPKTAMTIQDLLFELVAETRLTLVVVTHHQGLSQACSKRFELGAEL